MWRPWFSCLWPKYPPENGINEVPVALPLKSWNPRPSSAVPNLDIAYAIGSQTGVREVVQGVRGEKISAITENGRNSQNVPFETELQLSDGNIICASKSPKFPCILSCKAVFLSYKHNNDRNDEQALITKQNHSENVTSVLNSAPATQDKIQGNLGVRVPQFGKRCCR